MQRSRRRRRLQGGALALALALVPATSLAQEVDLDTRSMPRRIADGSFDVLFLRPSALAVSVAGAILFVPAVVMTAPGGREHLDNALDRFVLVPGRYLATRPVGEF